MNEKMIKILSEDELEKKWREMSEEERNECCLYQHMSINFITKHQKTINFDLLSVNKFITFDILDKFSSRINWVNISLNGKELSDVFIAHYANKIVWNLLLMHQQLNLKLLIYLSEKYRKNSKSKQAKMFWNSVSRYQAFDVEYVDAYKRYLNFNTMSVNPHIDNITIDKYVVNFNTELLMSTHTIPEDIIQKHFSLFRVYIKNKEGN